MRALVTGGAGFIGSALVRRLLADGHEVLNVDKLTYAADRRHLDEISECPGSSFAKVDITDRAAVRDVFASFRPEAVFHLAAESHVDRSIDGPGVFVETNIVGTFVMLEAALDRVRRGDALRFLHISTDEVYGSLGPQGVFTETHAYEPNSPYAASKAGADHLVRAWVKTFGLPALISNCSNNYGPRQNAEKLIPTIIRNALTGRPIPIYGDGRNVRDWLFVDDHVEAMLAILEEGRVGEKYNVGGNNEIENIEIARLICRLLDAGRPKAGGSYEQQITFVEDRPGHDRRYAIDSSKAQGELGWSPSRSFDEGIAETVEWYLAADERWMPRQGEGDRLGLERKVLS